MKPVAMRRGHFVSETRASAMNRPPMPPPAKAIADSAIVHCAATTMNQNSLQPKGLISIGGSSTAQRIFEACLVDRRKDVEKPTDMPR